MSADRSALRSVASGVGLVLLVTASAALTSYCVGVAVTRVMLTNFRSYAGLELNVDRI